MAESQRRLTLRQLFRAAPTALWWGRINAGAHPQGALTEAPIPTAATEAQPAPTAQPSYECAFGLEIRTERTWWRRGDPGRREIRFELYSSRLPKTCKKFKETCRKGQYNGFVFHEISEEYMQTGAVTFGKDLLGEPLADSEEVKSTKQGKLPADSNLSHAKGYRLSALRGSSKFIITGSKSAKWLDTDYIVFGNVISADEKVVDAIIRDYGSISRRPSADISISSCTVEKTQE